MKNKNAKTVKALRERERERAYLYWNYLEELGLVLKH